MFIAKTEVVIGRSQLEPRSGEGCDQADHGRPAEAMKVFLATVSHTNGRGATLHFFFFFFFFFILGTKISIT